MKKFISGLLIGILITLSITAFAASELNIISNPYPVTIDGQATDVEGYNINGFTFLKLADFKKAGLTVTFNETDKQIEITTADVSTAALSVKQNNILGGSTMSIEYDPVTGLPVGAEYVTFQECKTAIKYNNNTFMSRSDLSKYLNVTYKSLDVKAQTTTYSKGDSLIIIDMSDKTKYFTNKQGTPFLNVNLF